MLKRATEDHAAYESVTGGDPATSESMLRAEEAVDRAGERVGHFVSATGHGLLSFVARAREEAEDIWAEAQSIRNGQTRDTGLEDMTGEDASAAPNVDEALAE